MARNRIRTLGWICFTVAFGVVGQPTGAQGGAGSDRYSDKSAGCLTANIYHEARGEPFLGQLAVAQVVLNRVADPRWPDSICAVVWQKYQFSWTHDHLSDEMTEQSAREYSAFVARNILDEPLDLDATHYHSNTVSPTWADKLKLVATIGNHIFYKE